MAQKETSSKSRRWLGLSGAAVLVANLVLTGTTIAFQQEGEVNHALGIEGAGASYGGTEFSADGTLSDASYAKYIEAAYQFCEQEEEEGSVLLYNRNNALPLSESERNVTVFGRGSIDPVFRSTAGGSSTNPDYQKTPVDALQDAGFLAGILQGRDVVTAGRMGAICGALATQTPGDVEGYPDAAQMEAALTGAAITYR